MSIFTAQLYPGRALGFLGEELVVYYLLYAANIRLVLGASLHDIITRLKAEPQRFPKLELVYSPHDPVREPVVLMLPVNGVRLRFDGREQRLRLIEVVDFSRNHITFQDRDVVKPAFTAQGIPTSPIPGESPGAGPTFRHIYNRLLGPTYGGEFIPPEKDDGAGSGGSGDRRAAGSAAAAMGTYVLSYPGVAFSFPLPVESYSPHKDVVSLLSSSSSGAGLVATSMAVFAGDSWAHARETLWTEVLPSIKTFAPFAAAKGGQGGGTGVGGGGGVVGGAAGAGGIGGKDVTPDEISLVRIHGGGRVQLMRRWTSASTWITLGETTPQELVAELGPPDAIYRKNDQRMYIHKIRTASNSRSRGGGVRPTNIVRGVGEMEIGSLPKGTDDGTDTDQSSAHTGSDDHDSDDEAIEDDYGVDGAPLSGECFYNYFYLGFDVLVSPPVPPSRLPPSLSNGAGAPQYPGINDAGGNLTGVASHSPSHSPSPTPAAPVQGAYAGGVIPEKPVRAVPSPDRLVATKIVLHGNVPGSYPFNRHRRCRWEIPYLQQPPPQRQQTMMPSGAAPLPPGTSPQQQYQRQFQDPRLPPQQQQQQQLQNTQLSYPRPMNSETPFDELELRLREEWAPVLFDDGTANSGGIPGGPNQRQRGMVLNRGWGDSPGSSCEFLGGWEDSATGSMSGLAGAKRTPAGKRFDGSEDSTTTLYGFPGLVFEVLRNGFVSAVTVY